MPLLDSFTDGEAQIMVWHIAEEESFFTQHLGFSSDKKHPMRRLEHLSGRYLLQCLYPGFPFDAMKIAAMGKPELPDSNVHFSISHSFPYAAAIISTEKPVGIDIQIYQEKILRLQTKFLSEQEQHLCANDIPTITLAWSAKEALFKKYGLGAVDFIKHMPISQIGEQISIHFQKENRVHFGVGKLSNEFALAYFL